MWVDSRVLAFSVHAGVIDFEVRYRILAASQECPFMLASPANQSAGSETQVAENKARAANIMALEFAGAEHEPVLLLPGKWNIGAASSNKMCWIVKE